MKTTLDLPDDLMRAVKVRAAQNNRKLKDTVAELLRAGLDQERESVGAPRHRVKLPLIVGNHPASAEEEITPERAAEILNEEEASAYVPMR